MMTRSSRALTFALASLMWLACGVDVQTNGVPDSASFGNGGGPALDTDPGPAAPLTDAAAAGDPDVAADADTEGGSPEGEETGQSPEEVSSSDDTTSLDDAAEVADGTGADSDSAAGDGDETVTCTPDCAGADCGPDGCGGACGDCVPGELCSQGTCIEPGTCNPACDGKTCGPDGCGGICGYCTYPEVCDPNGQCVEVCVPSCDGKFCGPDGCGGACGLCEVPLLCGSDGLCYQPGCVPSCAGQACGGDGCGGDCGFCAEPKICQNGTCQLGPCGTVTSVGECQANVVVWCSEGVFLLEDDCDTYEDHGCTYDPFANSYACKPVGPCTPKCDDKLCGSDACGGWCGLCPSGWSCLAGSCSPEQGADCGGEITTLGECIDNVLWFCSLEKLYSVQCVDTGQGCAWDQSQGKFNCL
jgi:hypothetical protein